MIFESRDFAEYVLGLVRRTDPTAQLTWWSDCDAHPCAGEDDPTGEWAVEVRDSPERECLRVRVLRR